MKTWAALRSAFEGWVMLARGQAGWQGRFRTTPAGLVTALVLFYVFAFLAIVLASLDVGVPNFAGVVEIMAVQSLWLAALLAGIAATRAAVRSKIRLLDLLVPGIYALIFYLVAGTLISLTLGILLPLLWLALAYLLFRLGRLGAGWTVGVAAAFAALTVVLLVGLPMTLYMLASSPAPPA